MLTAPRRLPPGHLRELETSRKLPRICLSMVAGGHPPGPGRQKLAQSPFSLKLFWMIPGFPGPALGSLKCSCSRPPLCPSLLSQLLAVACTHVSQARPSHLCPGTHMCTQGKEALAPAGRSCTAGPSRGPHTEDLARGRHLHFPHQRWGAAHTPPALPPEAPGKISRDSS